VAKDARITANHRDINLCRLLKSTDFSEKHITSIFWVEE
jgi:hypothetical protein